MKKKGLLIKIGAIGVIAAAGISLAACGSNAVDETTTTLTATVDPAVNTVTGTTTESTTAIITETETTKGADLGHEGSTVIETEPLTNSYIISDSDSRVLSKDDLKSLDAKTLRLARNEIYARHGYIFKDQSLLDYFKGKSWYEPAVKADDFRDTVLNDYEVKNIGLMTELEKELNGNTSGNSDTDKILGEIEGSVWVTIGQSGYIKHIFHEGVDSVYETVLDGNGTGTENHRHISSIKIENIKKFEKGEYPEDSAGYILYLEGGQTFFYFLNDKNTLVSSTPEDFSGGYSGSSSLGRTDMSVEEFLSTVK